VDSEVTNKNHRPKKNDNGSAGHWLYTGRIPHLGVRSWVTEVRTKNGKKLEKLALANYLKGELVRGCTWGTWPELTLWELRQEENFSLGNHGPQHNYKKVRERGGNGATLNIKEPNQLIFLLGRGHGVVVAHGKCAIFKT